MPIINSKYTPEMRRAKVLVYDKCGFKFTNFIPESESVEYAAASFHLNEKSVTWRVSKITPTKIGQFVTLWKRNEEGVICPHQSNEATNLYVIHCLGDNLIGQFVFTKEILIQQGVLSSPGKKGKLGFRVYPKWDIAKNKQAQTTQNWQLNYFLELNRKSSSDLSRIHALYGL